MEFENLLQIQANFNSHPPAEGDLSLEWERLNQGEISTHTLPRRATLVEFNYKFRKLSFQLTPSRGGRRSPFTICSVCAKFQLTPSRGGRLLVLFLLGQISRFQLTPSRGGRQSMDLLFNS